MSRNDRAMKYLSHHSSCVSVTIASQYLSHEGNSKLECILNSIGVASKFQAPAGKTMWLRDESIPISNLEYNSAIPKYHDYGNIVAVPKLGTNQVTLLVGANPSIPDELRAFLEEKTNVSDIVEIETSWLSVGHMDEVVCLCPKWYSQEDTITFFVVDAMLGYEYLRHMRSLRYNAIEDSVIVPHSYGTGYGSERRTVRFKHLSETSQQFQRNIERTKGIIEATMLPHKVMWIRIPVLFGSNKHRDYPPVESLKSNKIRRETGFSILPNAVNCLVANEIVFIPIHPEQKNSLLDHIKAVNEELDIDECVYESLHFLEVAPHPYINLTGHLHCATSQEYEN